MKRRIHSTPCSGIYWDFEHESSFQREVWSLRAFSWYPGFQGNYPYNGLPRNYWGWAVMVFRLLPLFLPQLSFYPETQYHLAVGGGGLGFPKAPPERFYQPVWEDILFLQLCSIPSVSSPHHRLSWSFSLTWHGAKGGHLQPYNSFRSIKVLVWHICIG